MLNQACTQLLCRACPHLELSADQLSAFGALHQRLWELNQVLNVTAVTEMPQVVLKHFADSLSLLSLPALADPSRPLQVADVGCGGGFPGVPLALLRPRWQITMIDSTEKKIRALQDTCALLGLTNVEPLAGRAEELCAPGGPLRQKKDLVVSRALARLDVLCELCLPMVKPGGLFVAMKGRDAAQELAQARSAVETLGGRVVDLVDTTLNEAFFQDLELSAQELEAAREFAQSRRALVVIEKIAPTPKLYPRRYAQIKKSPL